DCKSFVKTEKSCLSVFIVNLNSDKSFGTSITFLRWKVMRHSVSCLRLFSGTKLNVLLDKTTSFPFTEGEISNSFSFISCPAIHSDLSKLNTILISLSLETKPDVKLEMYSL